MLTTQLGDLAARARRALHLTGRVPLSLDETIVPTAQLLDLTREPFSQYPRRWAFPFSFTPTVSLVGFCVVRNPAGSNAIVVFDNCLASLQGGSGTIVTLSIARQINGAVLTAVSQPTLLNIPGLSTAFAPQKSITQFGNGTIAGISGTAVAQYVPAGSMVPMFYGVNETSVVLFPGDDAIVTLPTGTGPTLIGTVFGREYPDTTA